MSQAESARGVALNNRLVSDVLGKPEFLEGVMFCEETN